MNSSEESMNNSSNIIKRTKEIRKYHTEKLEEVNLSKPVSVELIRVLHFRHRAGCFAFQKQLMGSQPVYVVVAVSLSNNFIKIYRVDKVSTEWLGSIDLPGHRSDIRAAALSNDDFLLFTVSKSGCKLWNTHNGRCIRSIENIGSGLCTTFFIGKILIAIGTKEGHVQIVDTTSGLLVKSIKAHRGDVISICSQKDFGGLITGGKDNFVKFWTFRILQLDKKT
jgi:U3 small nucleolar RNA-associated protein 12